MATPLAHAVRPFAAPKRAAATTFVALALRASALFAVALLASFFIAACGGVEGGMPHSDPPGIPIGRAEGDPIFGADGWTWISFQDAYCTDSFADYLGRYTFGTSTTGLAVSWGPDTSRDVVIFLQGGGACWDFLTCGGAAPLVPKTANTGPFGANQFAQDIYAKYPNSWVHRENLPPSLAQATIVFVPYCTGDVHSGDQVTTYYPLPGYAPITWHHLGRANLTAFLKRLGPTFPDPTKVVIAGSSAGGFGSLANYVLFRSVWPGAKGYLVDDSGPPLIGDTIPFLSRLAWYANWNLGASLDSFCPDCRTDMSQGLVELERRYPNDRIALISHLHDEVIRGFFGTMTFIPEPGWILMPADEFEAALRELGTSVMDPATVNAKYFFTTGDGHPTLEDPTVVTTPPPGLPEWLDLMLSDSASWVSTSD